MASAQADGHDRIGSSGYLETRVVTRKNLGESCADETQALFGDLNRRGCLVVAASDI